MTDPLSVERVHACLTAAAITESGQVADEVLFVADAVIRSHVREYGKGIVDIPGMLHASFVRWSMMERNDAVDDGLTLRQLRRVEYEPVRTPDKRSSLLSTRSWGRYSTDLNFAVPIGLASSGNPQLAFRIAAAVAEQLFPANDDCSAAGALAALVALVRPYEPISITWQKTYHQVRDLLGSDDLGAHPDDSASLSRWWLSLVASVEQINEHRVWQHSFRTLSNILHTATGLAPRDGTLRPLVHKLSTDFVIACEGGPRLARLWTDYPGV